MWPFKSVTKRAYRWQAEAFPDVVLTTLDAAAVELKRLSAAFNVPVPRLSTINPADDPKNELSGQYYGMSSQILLRDPPYNVVVHHEFAHHLDNVYFYTMGHGPSFITCYLATAAELGILPEKVVTKPKMVAWEEFKRVRKAREEMTDVELRKIARSVKIVDYAPDITSKITR